MSAATADSTVIREAWDRVADDFDRHITPRTIAFGSRIVSGLPLGPGVRVLDVGAGSGGLSIPAARVGAEVVAVDISPTMVERLRARAHAEGLATLEARVGDGAALGFPDDVFDLTMSLNGVSLFPDLHAGLRELTRVTRPGGQVVVATFGPLPQVEFVSFFLGALRVTAPEVLPPASEPLPPFRLADPAVFRTALDDAGLSDIRVDDARWDTAFSSTEEFLEVVLASNPIAGQLTAGLTADQFAALRDVLEGMLRERSGGVSGGVLHTRIRIGRGSV